MGLTLARSQFEFGRAHFSIPGRIDIQIESWLTNSIPSNSMDAVVFIESSEHMPPETAFKEANRILRPNGRMGICAWAAPSNPSPCSKELLLEPICREGRLTGLLNKQEYHHILQDAGFQIQHIDDLTQYVQKTWSVCLSRMFSLICASKEFRTFLRSRDQTNRVFAKTVARIWLAYHIGAMRYLAIFAQKR